MILSPAETDELVERIATAVAAKLAHAPKLVDRHSLATIVGVSVPTIERLQAAGAIPVVRVNRRVLYSPDAVVAALASADDE